MLLALLVVAALAVVAPAECACPLDLHRGESLHVVFQHPHPETAAESDGLAVVTSAGSQMFGGEVASHGGPGLGGEVLPLVGVLPQPAEVVGWLGRSTEAEPDGVAGDSPDPPPELA
jgi:hypothetical protein